MRTGLVRLSGMFVGKVTEKLELFRTAIVQIEYMGSRSQSSGGHSDFCKKKNYLFFESGDKSLIGRC